MPDAHRHRHTDARFDPSGPGRTTMISFVWPLLLGFLALVPILGLGYVVLDRRRRAELAALALRGFTPTTSAAKAYRKRHVPVALFGAAIALMLAAMARPQVALHSSRREGIVMLAFDVSTSMRATDVRPTRLVAAQRAARRFVERQPSRLRIGVVAFSGGGVMMQRPTRERGAVVAAIDRLRPSGPTSLGQGMFSALSAIAGSPLTIDPLTLGRERAEVPYLGSAAAVVLFSDGENTAAPAPLDVAKLASVAGVKIFTVGVGLADATVLDVDGYRLATTLDETLLAEIARVTNGAYVRAGDVSSLTSVYDSIELQRTSGVELREVTSFVSALSILLLGLGSAFATRWFGRML